MLRRFFIVLFMPWLLLASASEAAASDFDVTVLSYRSDGASEIYFSARADILFALFDTAPNLLARHDGLLDFGDLAQGTFEAGDHLIKTTSMNIGPNPADFEAMSLMFHPLVKKLPLGTPLDAMIAIGVCNGPPAGTRVALRDLQSYAGFFTDVGNLNDPIAITFPGSRHATLRFRVLVFEHDGKLDDRIVRLEQGQSLTISNMPSRPQTSLWFFVVALALGSFVLMSTIRLQASKPQTVFTS